MATRVLDVQGVAATIRKLDTLESGLIKTGLVKATRAAGQVIVRYAGQIAPRDKGRLYRTMGQSVKHNRTEGEVEARIGQSTRKRKRYKAMHVHLVENPTAPHTITRELPNGGRQVRRHPGTKGRRFLKTAAELKIRKAELVFEKSITKFVDKHAIPATI